MRALTKFGRYPWSIFDELDSLQGDFNRALCGAGLRSGTTPPMGVWLSDDSVVVDIELPGVDPKDVDISVEGAELNVSGKRGAEAGDKGTAYHRRERARGEFRRTVRLPFRVAAEEVKAEYRHGVLRVTLPRVAEDRRRKVEIQAA